MDLASNVVSSASMIAVSPHFFLRPFGQRDREADNDLLDVLANAPTGEPLDLSWDDYVWSEFALCHLVSRICLAGMDPRLPPAFERIADAKAVYDLIGQVRGVEVAISLAPSLFFNDKSPDITAEARTRC